METRLDEVNNSKQHKKVEPALSFAHCFEGKLQASRLPVSSVDNRPSAKAADVMGPLPFFAPWLILVSVALCRRVLATRAVESDLKNVANVI